MNDDASDSNASSADLFIASRLIVNLLIGFVAGIVAGLSMGLTALFSLDGDINTLLGIAAAGYVGTDFIESFAPTISGKIPPVSSAKDKGAPHPEQIQPQSTSNHDFNSNWGVIFGSLIPNGFFSADPDDLRKSRSIRTNNPGALDFAAWQKARVGYVGISQPDDSSAHNITTIYRTPEHGIGA